MQTDPISVIISLVIGTIVGLGYFAGLWITVQTLPTARRPRLVWALSAVLRALGATIVFIILLRWGTTQVVAGLAGFVIARLGATAVWGPSREPKLPRSSRDRGAGEQ